MVLHLLLANIDYCALGIAIIAFALGVYLYYTLIYNKVCKGGVCPKPPLPDPPVILPTPAHTYTPTPTPAPAPAPTPTPTPAPAPVPQTPRSEPPSVQIPPPARQMDEKK